MSTLRVLRNFWMLWVATIVLACLGNAAGQTSYKVTDLGIPLNNGNLGCAMSLNNQGWTLIMSGNLPPGQQDNFFGKLLNGGAAINIDGFIIDLGTLGGANTWMNWGRINDRGQAVGFSETAVLDPEGEDVCGFGTGRTCLPFLWQDFHMSALPTLGGNNGQASDINNRGEIAGFAENGAVDSTCPPGTPNNRIALPALWEKGQPQALPLVGSDADGVAFAINDQGQAVGYSGTCTTALHAVSWTSGTANPLPDLGTGALAQGSNDLGQIVGTIGSADGTTEFGAVWQNGALTNLNTLPGDFASIATGINNRGQVVGSTLDSHFNWSHGFIWQDHVMTDLNTLFPADSNLFATMANKINERGQISGMAIVRTGPHEGDIHAFLATPVNASIGRSIADVAPTRPKSNVPANVGRQLLHGMGPGRFDR